MPNYPMIALTLRFKALLPWLVAALFVLGGVWGMYRSGAPEFLVGGVILAGVFYVTVRLCLELVEVISDTLLPR